MKGSLVSIGRVFVNSYIIVLKVPNLDRVKKIILYRSMPKILGFLQLLLAKFIKALVLNTISEIIKTSIKMNSPFSIFETFSIFYFIFIRKNKYYFKFTLFQVF